MSNAGVAGATRSIRDELRRYSKGDLTRIAVVATRKQAAAEHALKVAGRGVWTFVFVSIVLAFAAGAGSAWWAFR